MSIKNTYGISNINTVADDLAIRKVIAANEQAITDNNPEQYAITFAEDATVKYWDGIVTGRESLKDYFIKTQGRESLRDVVINLVIEIDGDEAKTVGSGLIIRSKQIPVQILATAGIFTHLKKVDGTWYISFQEKKADFSFDPAVGTLADVVNKLEKRIEQLEIKKQ